MICRVIWRTVSNFRRKMYGIYYGRKEIRAIGELKLIYISLKIPPLPVCTVKGVHIRMSFRFFILYFQLQDGAERLKMSLRDFFVPTNRLAIHLVRDKRFFLFCL